MPSFYKVFISALILIIFTNISVYAEQVPKTLQIPVAVTNDTLTSVQKSAVSDTTQQVSTQPQTSDSPTIAKQSTKGKIYNLAISDFIGRGIDSTSALILSDRFRASLIGLKNLKLLERNQMDVILKEQGFQRSGACDFDACLVQIGQLLGTEFIVAGTVGKIGDIYSFNIRMIQIETGEIVYSITKDVKQPLEEVLSVVIPDLATRFHDEVTRVSSASIEIQSVPKMAMVSVDGKEKGLTPLKLNGISEGTHILSLSMEHHTVVTDSLVLTKGGSFSKIFTLKYTPAYLDSCKIKRRKIVRHVLQSTFAIAAAGSFVAGSYYQYKIGNLVNERNAMIREYDNAGPETDFASYRSRAKEQEDLFNRWKKYRNAAFVAGALLTAGLTITIIF